MLRLADLGAYAIGLITTVEPGARLQALGLFDATGPQPPRPLADLLDATAHGQLQTRAGAGAVTVALSLQGMYRTGHVRPDSLGDENLAERNGSLNGSCSGSPNRSRNGSDGATPGKEGLTALQCAAQQVERHISLNPWDSWDERIEGSEIPSPAAEDSLGGGDARILHLPTIPPGKQSHLDPEWDQLLQAIGIRNRAALARVPCNLIAAWHEAVQHPGLQARFRDPAAFAYSQLLTQTPPPGREELDRWARMAEGRAAPPGQGRHYAPVPPGDEEQHATLLRRAWAIAGAAGDLAVSYVLTALEQGMDEGAALAYSQAELDRQAHTDSEEVYRGLRTRTAR